MKRTKIAKELFKIAKGLMGVGIKGASMQKYLVMYNPKNRKGEINYDDVEKCWVYANNPKDAEEQAMSEYWDIGEIVDVRRL